MHYFSQLPVRSWQLLALLLLLTILLALPLSVFAHGHFSVAADETAIDAIATPKATNDATNVYYQFSHSGGYSYYRAYIDTDQSSGTGFQSNGIGANYLVENNTLYRYTGTGSDWSWGSIKTVTYTNSGGIAKWTIMRTDIGEGATPNQADLVFQVEAPLQSTTKLTHLYSGSATPTRTPTTGPTNTPTRTPTASPTPAITTKTVIYSSTTALFPNPERGFYRYYESRSSAPTVWAVADFQNTNAVAWLSAAEEATITQAYCLFYLDTFLNSNISETFLTHIRTNLANVRAAGRKCLLRFAYTWDDSDTNGNGIPDVLENATQQTEPDLPQLLAHIDQLKPIWQEYGDVIAVLQAGFIGIWGEWYYTDHFVDDPTDPDAISATQYERRKIVVQRLLDSLPANRMIALRYPLLKKQMFGRTTPITDAEAFQNTPLARLGFHNDAFLNSYGDSGTFQSDADRAYLQAESLYLTMGGEVNQPEADAPARSCANALAEMAKYHWSYINTDYYLPTLQSWKKDKCIHNTSNIAGSILDRLGYRLVLKKGIYPTMATVGGALPIRIELVNEGFAAPFNPRDLYVVLQNKSTSAFFTVKLPDDPRRWLANGQTQVIARTLALPGNLPAGSYALYLYLPDPAPPLNTKAAYAIRMANANLWKSASGWNDLLHTITVSSSARAETSGIGEEGLTFVEAGVLSESDNPTAMDLPDPEAEVPAAEVESQESNNSEMIEQANRLFLPIVTH